LTPPVNASRADDAGVEGIGAGVALGAGGGTGAGRPGQPTSRARRPAASRP